MLVWTLLALGVLIIVVRAVVGHRAALALTALWIGVAVIGWATGIGVRK